jgi:hypothetical protein
MKVANLILAVMFLAFAFVQVNDPDPLLWILIYGAMAVVCVLAAFDYSSRIAMVILLVGFLAYSILLLPGLREWLAQDDKSVLFDDIAKMQHLYIEEAREFLGLIICIVVLGLNLVRSSVFKKNA